jgi:hypothetical protein
MLRYIVYITLTLLTACHAGEYYHYKIQESVRLRKESDTAARAFDSLLKSMESSRVVNDPNSDSFSFPDVEEKYAARLLQASTYHTDEVDSSAFYQPWYGLFKDASGYYLKQTRIHAERIEDAVLDEGGEKTGWGVSTTIEDTSLVLFSGLVNLWEGPVEVVHLPKQQLLPGEELGFQFKGESYKLYATGESRKNNSETTYSNYKLFLQRDVRGKKESQLLVSHPVLDEAMVQILFAGDLNRDGLPDLLLDTTWHYNATVPTLYLSVSGGKGGLLQIVALHMSVGC